MDFESDSSTSTARLVRSGDSWSPSSRQSTPSGQNTPAYTGSPWELSDYELDSEDVQDPSEKADVGSRNASASDPPSSESATNEVMSDQPFGTTAPYPFLECIFGDYRCASCNRCRALLSGCHSLP